MTDTDDSAKHKAALGSFIAALCLTGVKLGVGLFTNSLGLLFEAMHSGLDMLAAGMTLAAVHIASQPPDKTHPYGHGKAENLSALGATVLLFATCIWAVWEGAERLVTQHSPVLPSLWSVAVMVLSIAVDVTRSRILSRTAKRHRSQALEADALHFATDVWSSSVVLVGVLAVWLADALQLPQPLNRLLVQTDTVAALIVACIILWAGYRMARDAINALMDSGSPDEERRIRQALATVDGITDIRRVRMRSSGPQSFVDLTVGVEPDLPVKAGHSLAAEAERKVEALLPGADVTVHVEPLSARTRGSEDPFDIVQRLSAIHGLTAHNVQLLQGDAGRRLELHVEMPGDMPFVQAYDRILAFQTALRDATGGEAVVHMEPEGSAAASRTNDEVPEELSRKCLEAVERIAAEEPQADTPHRISLYEMPGTGLCLSLHCCVDSALTVEKAHAVCRRLEKRLREAVPELRRITTHIEPGDAFQYEGTAAPQS
ncbi:MAG: cation-efflux pump [Desulfovibrio sp.]|jgi:cation diffusion facilitator family transporter|nr:cation-efflux pump [Desulfovibrio sp.]